MGLASNRSSTYWSRVQFKVSPGKVARSVARALPNKEGEFLKPCGSQVQVSCVFLPVCRSSPSKANKGWLADDNWRQKASLSTRWSPNRHERALQNQRAAQSPVAPTIVVVWSVRGVAGVVTTECSAPVFTIKVIDCPPPPYFCCERGIPGTQDQGAQFSLV